jgi:hypothetical protein
VSRNANPAWRWLTAAVLSHLVISIVHGWAHTGANVPLSRSANLFVFSVIVAGPLVGLVMTWPAQRIGAWLIAATMAGSLVFGLVNHFVFASPDHVAHVAGQWRPLFASTAVLLAITEAIGFGLAIRVARERKSAS